MLFEEIIIIGGEDYLTGYTREYVKVALKSGDEKLINEIRDVHIEGFINDEVMSAILC